MTTDEIRIAMAELEGWTKLRVTVKGSGAPERGPSPHGFPFGKNYEASVSDYLADWNSVHRVVNHALTDAQRLTFLRVLDDLTLGNGQAWFPARIVTATPLEWCEAVLRVVGKWKD